MAVLNKIFLGLPVKVYLLCNKRLHFELAERELFFRRGFSALSFNGIDGDYAEFGCHGGFTFGLAYKQSRKNGMRVKLWAFDSFCGMPPKTSAEDEHPKWEEGGRITEIEEFRKLCFINGIPSSEFAVVAGFYKDSLSGSSDKDFLSNICMAYIDCDLYGSTVAVLEYLVPRLKHGMIIAFDDYYCWSASQVSGERKACADFFRDNKNWALVPFVQFGWHGMSFIVESRKLGGMASISY